MPVYISWNFVNWVTVVLMAAIGMAAVGAVSSFIRTNLPGGSGTTSDAGAS